MKYIIYLLCATAIISCKRNNKREYLPIETDEEFQVYYINTKSDTTLKGEKGTIIKINANSFLTYNGEEANGQVTLKVKEFYTTEDFINNRLSTNTTDGRILRSSGMLFIEAQSDTSQLKLKDDHPITLMFKRVQESKTANLFAGRSGTFSEIKWDLLEPVHSDTIAILEEMIIPLSYGPDQITPKITLIVGEDSIQLTRENKDFEKMRRRFFRNETLEDAYASYNRDPDRFYVFETTNLGYINCDIFITDELHEFTVQLDNSTSDVFIVLDSLNSVIYPDTVDFETNDYVFSLPRDKLVSIVAYNKDDGKHYMGVERTKSGPKNLFVQQKEESLAEIRRQIKQISEVAK